jgi:DNA-binding MarR family transcriptional regulator
MFRGGTVIFPIEKASKIILRRADFVLERLVGVGRREMWVLLCINNQELSQRRCGELLDLHPNVPVKLIDGMEGKKLLKRVRRSSDRREQILTATDRGKTCIEKYLEARPKILLEIFAPLSEEQIYACRDLLLLIIGGAATSHSPEDAGVS